MKEPLICQVSGKKFLAMGFMLVSLWFSLPLYGQEKETSQKKFSSRVIEGKEFEEHQVLDEEAIGVFVRSKEAYKWILEGMYCKEKLISSFHKQVGDLRAQYPEDPALKKMQEIFGEGNAWIQKALKSEKPFFLFGVFPIEDDALLPAEDATFKKLQAQVFKQWLKHYRLGGMLEYSQDLSLLKDIASFCRNSTSFFARKQIEPFTLELLAQSKDQEHYFDIWDDMKTDYIDSEWYEYEDDNKTTASEDLLPSTEETSKEEKELPFGKASNKEVEAIIQRIMEEGEKQSNEISRRFFSRDAILKLFFHTTEQWKDLRDKE